MTYDNLVLFGSTILIVMIIFSHHAIFLSALLPGCDWSDQLRSDFVFLGFIHMLLYSAENFIVNAIFYHSQTSIIRCKSWYVLAACVLAIFHYCAISCLENRLRETRHFRVEVVVFYLYFLTVSWFDKKKCQEQHFFFRWSRGSY